MKRGFFGCFLALAATLIFTSPSSVRAADDYVPGPDSKPQEGVPKGKVTKHEFTGSKIFPGTIRDYWVYVPEQYDASKPTCFMVFQDGIQYQAPVVFDNLIHRKEIPVMIGLFIMHGRVPAPNTNAMDRFNRSYEYDSMNDNYVRFLTDEFLPHVSKAHSLNLSTNGADRGIAGASSGAICAFTAAWERPEAFQRVFSSIGTYVGLRGGNEYPTLIRKTEPKPLRVFLQDGSNDLNGYGGNWFLANQEMLSALEFAGYEVNHVWGDGGHNGKHATAIFPEALRWLWKDYPQAPKATLGRRQPVTRLLIPGEDWQLVSEGHKFTEGPAVNKQGELFFTDIPNNRIHKVDANGTVSVFAEDTGAANGLMFGADGKLYACANAKKQIVAYDPDGKVTVIAEGVGSNDLAINQNGDIYFTDPPSRKVYFIRKGGEPQVVDEGIAQPNGVRLSPDQTLLLVSDTAGQFTYSFQIAPDGKLQHKQEFFHLHMADGSSRSGADGMTVDTKGNLYVTTDVGLQVFDQPGRANSIIPKPQRAWLSNATFGGKDLDILYVTCGDKVYKRKTQAKGFRSTEAPIKPPRPGL